MSHGSRPVGMAQLGRTSHAAVCLATLLGGCASEASIDLFRAPRAVRAPEPEPMAAGGEPASGGADGGAEAPAGGGGGVDGGAGNGGLGGGSSGSGGTGGAGASGAGTSGAGASGAAGASDSGVGVEPRHRYRFEGTGVRVVDDVSSADGTIIGGAELDGSGSVVLDGNDDYVDLPNGLVSVLTDATFSAWVEWRGNNCWHRIFSFGNTVQGEDVVGERQTELLVTPVNCAGPSGAPVGVTSLFEVAGRTNTQVLTNVEYGSSVLRHTALVFDAGGGLMTLYLDGDEIGSSPTDFVLSDLIDDNNWLGRSQWEQDYNLPGSYEQFEVYDVALSSADVLSLFARGPD